MEEELFYTLALTFVPGLGLKRQQEILRHFGSAQAFFKTAGRQKRLALDAADDINGGLGNGGGCPDAPTTELCGGLQGDLSQALRRAEKEWALAARNGWHICIIGSPDYPALLGDCPDAPTLLFVRSLLPPAAPGHVFKRLALAVVGTRKASHYGRTQTDRLISELRYDPICTVSGLASGIDTQAHRSSLQYGLPTVAVVGHGLEQVYPAANTGLADEIVAAGGAIVTEMPSGTPIRGGLFPRRNRIIAGLSQAVVVAEASIKGGALITARIAHSYNRCLFAFPGKNDMFFSRGCNYLIKSQMAQLLETADDLRAEVAWAMPPLTGIQRPASGLPADVPATDRRLTDAATADRQAARQPAPDRHPSPPPANPDTPRHQLWHIIQRESPAGLEQLAEETGRPLPDLLGDLLALELAGAIRSLPGERYEPA